jgi:hypothetical protein
MWEDLRDSRLTQQAHCDRPPAARRGQAVPECLSPLPTCIQEYQALSKTYCTVKTHQLVEDVESFNRF